MLGSKNLILSNCERAKIIQTKNAKMDITVTYKIQKNMDKVVVFVTNYNHNNIPISSYFDIDDIQAVITKKELLKCCETCISQKEWRFGFWM